MAERNRRLHLVKGGNEHSEKSIDGCEVDYASPNRPRPCKFVPLKVRVRWYISLRYWKQAFAICCVNAATFILWEIAVR